mmetsp:Transcript_25660/g.39287  ORF Transcript_25660/g.39287 Transcript_25660/m.39287 type:complete len:224 (-) Transcript_25660:575-1246(-)
MIQIRFPEHMSCPHHILTILTGRYHHGSHGPRFRIQTDQPHISRTVILPKCDSMTHRTHIFNGSKSIRLHIQFPSLLFGMRSQQCRMSCFQRSSRMQTRHQHIGMHRHIIHMVLPRISRMPLDDIHISLVSREGSTQFDARLCIRFGTGGQIEFNNVSISRIHHENHIINPYHIVSIDCTLDLQHLIDLSRDGIQFNDDIVIRGRIEDPQSSFVGTRCRECST